MREVLKEMFVEIHVGRNENLNVLTGGEAVHLILHVEGSSALFKLSSAAGFVHKKHWLQPRYLSSKNLKQDRKSVV